MTNKEVNNLTYEILNKCLSEYGYKYNKSEMHFELKKGDYIYFITFKCVDRKPQYKITFVVDIRNGKVEDIANKFTQANPDYFKYSATVIIPFNYFKQQRLEIVISTENDFEKLRNFFCPFYKQNIQPFLDNHSTLDKLSLFIDKTIQESNEFMPITINLYRRSIILSKLTNDPEFENHVNKIRKMIAEFPDIDKKDFDDTYKYLKTL